MTAALKKPTEPLSPEADFFGWSLATASALRRRSFSGIDWDALAEEIEDMGRSERRALESRLEVLLAHLLKWQFQPQQRSTSWSGTIKEQRRRAQRLLRQNPSLRRELAEMLADAYDSARAMAERDTGMDESNFPELCAWTIESVLDEAFWPNAE